MAENNADKPAGDDDEAYAHMIEARGRTRPGNVQQGKRVRAVYREVDMPGLEARRQMHPGGVQRGRRAWAQGKE